MFFYKNTEQNGPLVLVEPIVLSSESRAEQIGLYLGLLDTSQGELSKKDTTLVTWVAVTSSPQFSRAL